MVISWDISAAIILSTDFTGRTVAGNTANTITWTTLGVNDPGSLTAIDVTPSGSLAGLFTTGAAAGHFAPDLNVDNEGPWAVDVPLAIAAGYQSVTLTDVLIDWQHFTNTGAFQGPNRTVAWQVVVTGSASGVIDTVSVPGVAGVSGIDTLTFGIPLLLDNTETYTLNIQATGGGPGNNTGLDAITLNGSAALNPIVPEPATWALFGFLTVIGSAAIRRRKGQPV